MRPKLGLSLRASGPLLFLLYLLAVYSKEKQSHPEQFKKIVQKKLGDFDPVMPYLWVWKYSVKFITQTLLDKDIITSPDFLGVHKLF